LANFNPLYLSGTTTPKIIEAGIGDVVSSNNLPYFSGTSTSGIVSGLGTGSTTKFLRADSTWQVPAGTAGSTEEVWVQVAGDTGTNTAKDVSSKLNMTGSGGTVTIADGASGISISSLNCADCSTAAFSVVTVAGQDNVAADLAIDTVTLSAGDNIKINTDSASDRIDFSSTDTTYTAGSGLTLTAGAFINRPNQIQHDDLGGFVANKHLDWTTDQGSNNIHADNYTDTTYTAGSGLTLTAGAFINKPNQIQHDDLGGFVANEHINWTTGQGGTNIHADNYTDTTYTAGSGITLTAGAFINKPNQIQHDDLGGFVANEHIDHTVVTITAGNALTGGGTIAANRTLDVTPTDFLITDADNDSAISGLTVNAIKGDFLALSGGALTGALTSVSDISLKATGSQLFVDGTGEFAGAAGVSGAPALTCSGDTLLASSLYCSGQIKARGVTLGGGTGGGVVWDAGATQSFTNGTGRDRDRYTGSIFQATGVTCVVTNTTAVSATWDTSTHNDPGAYIHADGDADVTVLRAGTYRITLNVGWRKTSTAAGPHVLQIHLTLNGTATNPYKIFMQWDEAGGGVMNTFKTGSATWIRTLSANDVLGIEAKMSSGTGSYTMQNLSSSWNLELL